ncbi:MAG: BatA domain-containing protein [Candidatus Latescibacterota bacterium]|nr:BatA domain-containing protein [Candidatus Latescibacterota bacterium]
MQFLNPLALVGLAAAAIPLAIHLLHRGRSRTIPFSNLAFLRQLHQSRMRQLRLRQWLVLLLRTLALIALSLAFARPALQTAGGGLFGTAGPTTSVILLDRSFSTRYDDGRGRIFDRLHHWLHSVSLHFDSGDEIFLVPFADRAEVLPLPTARLSEAVSELVAGESATDLGRALRTAARVMQDRQERRRELFMLTDLSARSWRAVDELPDPLSEVDLFVVAPELGPTPANLAVQSIRVDSWMAKVGAPISIDTRLANYGSNDALAVVVDLFLDGERARRAQVDIPGRGEAILRFDVSPRRSGHLAGFVEIESDHLDIDNRRYFTLYVPPALRVLVLGEQPSDSYYVRRALEAAAREDPLLSLRAARLEELDGSLDDSDVVFLCNPRRFTTSQAAALKQFLGAGGGVILFPGPTADLSRLNRDLLAATESLALSRVVGRPSQASVALDITRSDHALLEGLVSTEGSDLPQFHTRFELSSSRPSMILAGFSDGSPAIVQEGGIVLFAHPLFLEWTDLPLHGLFAPLLHRLCRRLVSPPAGIRTYTVGQRAWRRLPDMPLDARVQAEAPSGRPHYVKAETVLGQSRWETPVLEESGIWRMRGPDDTVVDLFAVNVNSAEGDLEPLTIDEAERRLDSVRSYFLDLADSELEGLTQIRYGRELWRECLILALLLLLVELWIARAPWNEADPALA